MKIELTAYQRRVLLQQLFAITDAAAETLDQKELDALDAIISNLNNADLGVGRDAGK